MLSLREKHEYEQEIAQLKATLKSQKESHALELKNIKLRLGRSNSKASKLQSMIDNLLDAACKRKSLELG